MLTLSSVYSEASKDVDSMKRRRPTLRGRRTIRKEVNNEMSNTRTLKKSSKSSKESDNTDIFEPSPPLPMEDVVETESRWENIDEGVTIRSPAPETDTKDCTEGLFHYTDIDQDTGEVLLDYYIDIHTHNCVVIDNPCPSFWDPEMITYSECAEGCLLPDAPEPC